MRRVISRPPTRPATSALAPLVGWLPHPARTSTLDTTDGSRSCQPQLSFIVPTIYGSVYTSADTRPSLGVPNFPAIHQRAIARISSPTTAQHTPLVLAYRVPPFAEAAYLRLRRASTLPPPAQPSQDTVLRPLRNVPTVHDVLQFFLSCCVSSHRDHVVQ